MAASIRSSSSFFFLSMGLHIALLVIMIVSIKPHLPKPAPVIKATVFFEKPRSASKQISSIVRKPVIKPELDSLIDPLSPSSFEDPELENPTIENEKLLDGFLRTNEFTQRKPIEKGTDPKTIKIPAPQDTQIDIKNQIDVKNWEHRLIDPSKPDDKTLGKHPGSVTDNESVSPIEASNTQFSQAWKIQNDSRIFKKTLAHQVAQNWIVPAIQVTDYEIMIETRVDEMGNLLSLNILMPANPSVLNIAAERAIRLSAPFHDIPFSLEDGSSHHRIVFKFTPDKVAN